jgi:hypothetical protein
MRMVQQTVGQVIAIDFDPLFAADAPKRTNLNWPSKLADSGSVTFNSTNGTRILDHSFDIWRRPSGQHTASRASRAAAKLEFSSHAFAGNMRSVAHIHSDDALRDYSSIARGAEHPLRHPCTWRLPP